MSDELALQPDCYKRHTEIDGHIKEGKFWRGVIVTVIIAGASIFIGQYSMAVENNNKMIALNSKLTTMVEVNTKRLDRLEDIAFYYKGNKGDTGATGAPGKDGK
jgi:hypothetical protein